MVGIALASVANLLRELWSLAALVALIAAIQFQNGGFARIWLLVMGFLCLGSLRFTIVIPEISDEHAAIETLMARGSQRMWRPPRPTDLERRCGHGDLRRGTILPENASLVPEGQTPKRDGP